MRNRTKQEREGYFRHSDGEVDVFDFFTESKKEPDVDLSEVRRVIAEWESWKELNYPKPLSPYEEFQLLLASGALNEL